MNEAPLILSREGIGMGNLFCPYQEAKFRPEAVVLFFSEQRDANEKIKLCKLMGAEIGAQRAFFFARASALVPSGFPLNINNVFKYVKLNLFPSSPPPPRERKTLKNECKLTLAYKGYFNFLTNSPKTFKTNLQRRDNKVRRFF